MVDANDCETRATEAAGQAAGEFIEATAKTADMAKWPVETWTSFIDTICGAYVGSLVAQQAALTKAMQKVQS